MVCVSEEWRECGYPAIEDRILQSVRHALQYLDPLIENQPTQTNESGRFTKETCEISVCVLAEIFCSQTADCVCMWQTVLASFATTCFDQGSRCHGLNHTASFRARLRTVPRTDEFAWSKTGCFCPSRTIPYHNSGCVRTVRVHIQRDEICLPHYSTLGLHHEGDPTASSGTLRHR